MLNKSTVLADEIVNVNAKYCQLAGQMVVEIDDLDEIEVYELAAHFMAEDGRSAYECLVENHYLDSDILPAIMAILHKPGNREATWNLTETIQKSIAHYYRKRTEELLQERLAIYCQENGYRNLQYAFNRSTGMMVEVNA